LLDEIDNNYKLIENMKNNNYLKYIMGLSCGTPDRTLLHTLFEHKYCKSIKIFFHKENTEVDNYLDIFIFRNFSNKEKMNDKFENTMINTDNALWCLTPPPHIAY